ncbi:hypothetical protein WQ57_07870 [Mesobacillus campisalis]|uniref:Uncharacterized protein n=1 Tax=Mesobacillus campisalis TaxID=1408103 RepID=A0A0M2SVC3_9BACI|nr:hypothetical protein [Mesobacillus campisalis]KKK38514.1 hypothetical protein WQ57_07870 [Mesobacillus campisalis]
MIKWILLAIAPIILLLLVEELSQWFWRRYINDSEEKKRGRLHSLLKLAMEKIRGWAANAKFKMDFRKNEKDHSH